MHAIGHQYQDANAFGVRLFPGQIARGLFVLYSATERRNPAARLEVERSARPYKVVGSRAVTKAQLLAFFQYPEWRSRVAHLCNIYVYIYYVHCESVLWCVKGPSLEYCPTRLRLHFQV